MIRKTVQRFCFPSFVSVIVLSVGYTAWAQVERPMIWATPAERAAIQQKIVRNDWAKELFFELKEHADAAVPDRMEARRETLLALPLVWPKDGGAPTLPTFRKAGGLQKSDAELRWGYPREQVTAIMKALQDAIDCGVLYYLTDKEKYATAAADILATFVNALNQTSLRKPPNKGGGNEGWLCDDHLLEARILGAQLPVIYDFVHPYLEKGGRVYDLASGALRDFDFAAGQKVFKTYVDLALNRGSQHNNWTVLESSSLLHNMMAIDDADERAKLLRYFVDKNTKNQGSLKHIYRHFQRPGDIWPESLGYSKHVSTLTIYHMTLVDRIDANLKLGKRFRNIPQSITAMYNLQYPNGDVPPLGDASRHYKTPYLTYEMALQLAALNKNTEQIKQFSGLLAYGIAKGMYDRSKLRPRRYGPAAYQAPLQLLWAVDGFDEDSEVNPAPPRPRSTHLLHAGATIQRNISKADKVKNSLMAVVAGGSFVHSHASGMDLELYGQGHVLGTDGGKSTYKTPIHENYYRIFAAHNTVISNGGSASRGGWQNLGIDRVKPVVLEPKAGEPGVSPNHSFATTRFTDKYNRVAPAEHQRTVALIRLSDEHGYYLDVFRAKSKTPKPFHDYVYHNVGDRLDVTSGGKAVAMKATPDRYQAPKKDKRRRGYQHPGWHYFEDVKSSVSSADGYEATFTADKLGDTPVVMRAWVPAGLKSEITQVSAPPSSVAPGSYRKKPLPTFLLRHHGDAWSNPFTVVYESHTGNPAVKSVDRLLVDGVFKGVKVKAEVNGDAIIQYVLIQENLDDVYTNKALGIQFKGQFAVLTVPQQQGGQSMYIGSGHELTYKHHRLVAEGQSNVAYRNLKKHANDALNQRMDAVIAHIKENPVNELPVGKHPKKPKVVFCRLFNISLSARAYFRLHTDPALDAASNQDLQKVAQWYLANPKKVRDPDSSYWAGEYHGAVLAKFGSRGTQRKGAVSRKTERLLLDYMFDYVNHWSRLEHYDASLTYETYYYWSTENHWWQEIVTAWGYLLALKDDPDFKDRKLADGKSLQEHYERTCYYMKQHMQQRARKGFLLEISSGGYSSRMHNMWYLIYDISPDANMRKLAKNTLDLYWAFWAEEQIAGERGGGKVRHRGLRGLGPNTGRHLIPAWLYFGAGTLGLDYIKSIPPDTIELAMHYMVLFSGYVPDAMIYKILEDAKTAPPYVIVQRRLGKQVPGKRVPEAAEMGGNVYDVKEGDCLKYSWVTPAFILGTVMRPPYDGDAWQKGTAQGWWQGLLISSGGPHDPPERVVPTFIQRRDISSDQYAVQSKGSMMTRKLLRGYGRDNSKVPMGVFLSRGLREYADHEGAFLFVQTPRCWVAVRAVGTEFILSNHLLTPAVLRKSKGEGDFYRMKNDHQPLIMEVADPGGYTSFEAFKKAVLGAKLVSKEGEQSYSSLSGDQLTMYDDRSTPRINSKQINYNPTMAYDSRYVKSKWDSGIVSISVAGMETILDFNVE